MKRAAAHGLQYLSEAEFHSMQTGRFAPEVARRLEEVSGGDPIAREQYLDFLKCRRFRQTLLCRAEVPLVREPQAEAAAQLYAASPVRAVSGRPEGDSDSVVRFEAPNGAGMETRHRVAKTALWRLGNAWPQSVGFAELLPAPEDAEALAAILLHAFAAGMVELSAHRFVFAERAGERPEASPLARRQAARGETVTTLRHTSLRLGDEVARRLVTLLDGTRDRAAIAATLAALPEITESSGELSSKLEASLERLAHQALLVASACAARETAH
jgi:hypothetical protein